MFFFFFLGGDRITNDRIRSVMQKALVGWFTAMGKNKFKNQCSH